MIFFFFFNAIKAAFHNQNLRVILLDLNLLARLSQSSFLHKKLALLEIC